MNIRLCTLTDIDQIIALQQEWQKEDITYGFVAADKALLESKIGKYFYVAEKASTIIAFAYGSIHKAENINIIPDGALYIEIDDIYTAKPYRSLGAGHLLLDKLLEVAKGNGIERSLLYSATKDMDSVVKFYRKHGYRTWYLQMYK